MSRIANLPLVAATLLKLGWKNVLRVGAYRLRSRFGIYERTTPIREAIVGPFFDWSGARPAARSPDGIDAHAWERDGERVLAGELPVFSHEWLRSGFPPDWNRSVITGVRIESRDSHWTDVDRFTRDGGDVKGFWEPARFDGLLVLVLAWLVTAREDFRAAIETWLTHFCRENPANAGVQWNCGQETSLRLLQVLLVSDLLRAWAGVRPTGSLRAFVAQHCDRVAATVGYAIGQDNNHGTSEAVALFAGGAMLLAGDPAAPRAGGWCAMGRRRLEERVLRLVMPDGSFAQHSTNYHRLMLDTVSLGEHLRRQFGQPEFSRAYLDRCAAAGEWLAVMTDPVTGGAPNLGANDGARILALHRMPYTDFRPAIHLARLCFGSSCAAVPDGAAESSRWLRLAGARPAGPLRAPRLFPDGGYATLSAGRAWLLLRLPIYRFRPGQADALHLDLWSGGHNLLRDGGSYSYATDTDTYGYFSGARSHNTVQFDGRESMPRISRFLFGKWLRPDGLVFDGLKSRACASYTDHAGARHERDVCVQDGAIIVRDTVSGFRRNAVLRWRLRGLPEEWTREGNAWRSGECRLELSASVDFVRLEMIVGFESRFYGDRQPLAVIEAEIAAPGTLTTSLLGTI